MTGVQFLKLADRPDAIPQVAAWYFEEWGYLNPAATADRIADKLAASLNRDSIPLVVLAVDGDAVVGAAELKYREMTIYPEKEHWLGGVFVAPKHRGRGVAARMIDSVVDTARTLGVKLLHLQTPQLDGGLYLKLGWRRIEQVHYNGLDVLVMEREI